MLTELAGFPLGYQSTLISMLSILTGLAETLYMSSDIISPTLHRNESPDPVCNASSLHSSCPNHCTLHFLINKLIDSSASEISRLPHDNISLRGLMDRIRRQVLGLTCNCPLPVSTYRQSSSHMCRQCRLKTLNVV